MILLLGDWVPEQHNPVIKINTRNEFVISNLEGPILQNVHDCHPSLKTGPHLFSTHLPVIQDADAVCFSLANNHINDYGWLAVQATMEYLDKQRYHWAGVGETEQLARRPLIITVNECRYAIFSLSEIQAGRSTAYQPGAAVLGPWIYKSIADVRSEVDLVIVSVHAGNEFLPWPSPLIQDLFRSYIDAGADIVHGHHSHVPQGVENYRNKVICYGLGNFIASPDRYKRFETQHSLGIRIDVATNYINYQIETYCFQQNEENVITDYEINDRLRAYLNAIQEPLTDRNLLEAIWQEAALCLYDIYGRDSLALPYTTEKRWSGDLQEYLRSHLRRLKRRYALYPSQVRQNQILWYNIFACLSHQHMMEMALGLLCGEIARVQNDRARELVTTYLPQLLDF